MDCCRLEPVFLNDALGGFEFYPRLKPPPKIDLDVIRSNIANGSLGYLPPAEEFDARTYQANIALHRSGSNDRVLEAASEAIGEMIAVTAR